ncbi:MAG: hypothetical protein ACM3SY_15605 [Candidatus Omnitrophota bacterium]
MRKTLPIMGIWEACMMEIPWMHEICREQLASRLRMMGDQKERIAKRPYGISR